MAIVEKAGLFASCLFLFLLPITHTTPLRLVCLGIAVLGAVAAVARGVRVPALPRGLALALVAWIGVCLAASFQSIEPAYSWGEFRNEVLVPMLAFATFHVQANDRATLRAWQATLFASFAAACSIALWSYVRHDDWLRASFVGDRNAYSTYIVLIVPFLLYWWSEATPNAGARRLAIGGALLFAMLSAAFTQNRNLWFGVLLEVVLWAALVYRRADASARHRLRPTYLVVGLVGAIVFVGALTHVIRDKARLSNLSAESQFRFDQDPRFEIWAYAAGFVAERPLTGYGFGRGIQRKNFREHFDNPLKWHGHNVLVNYTMEAGVAGALVLLGLGFALFRQAWIFQKSPDPLVAKQGVWILAMLAGIVVKMTTDDILIRENALLFWSLIGLSFGRCLRRGPADVIQSAPSVFAGAGR